MSSDRCSANNHPDIPKELIRKLRWQAETREQLLDRFVKSRPKTPTLTEKEIKEEVNAVRYGK